MKLTINSTRKGIVDTLANAKEAMTLAEIAEAMNVEKVATGTTNALVKANVLRKAGTRKVAKTVYVEVATYELGDEAENFMAEAEKASK